MCPMGAIAIYLHWLHDHYKLEERIEIDWGQNSSWRKVTCWAIEVILLALMCIWSGAICVRRISDKTLHRLEPV
jgi:hypothetical protein